MTTPDLVWIPPSESVVFSDSPYEERRARKDGFWVTTRSVTAKEWSDGERCALHEDCSEQDPVTDKKLYEAEEYAEWLWRELAEECGECERDAGVCELCGGEQGVHDVGCDGQPD